MVEKLLKVRELNVSFKNKKIVKNISFHINAGEVFALVGESGSGKSITALSVLRLLPTNAQVFAKKMMLNGENLLKLPENKFCKIRGKRIGLIFQDPMSSLNPVMTLREQIGEVLQIHFNYSKSELKQQIFTLLKQVEIPNPQYNINQYPHQLSGGQRQRAMIAIALAGKPDLLIADEATTALDVTIQAQIIQLLQTIQSKTGMALWFISHDLALVSGIANRIAVMYKGEIVETALAKNFFSRAKHPYSLKLLASLPSVANCKTQKITNSPQTCLLKVDGLKIYYPIKQGFFKQTTGYVRAVDGVSFELHQGKTLALVGESGCGKTTLGKSLLGLVPNSAGHILLHGMDLTKLTASNIIKKCSTIQIVYQDHFSSMNPRMLIEDIIEEGIKAIYPKVCATDRQKQVASLLNQVGLPKSIAWRYPHEFSGGQQQRICIARALAVKPKLLVCDEPTSSLDVSVQAQIIKLLKNLQKTQGLSYLFITHDLAVVAELAHQVAVMYQGKIVEYGEVKQVLTQPKHSYTCKLLKAMPMIF